MATRINSAFAEVGQNSDADLIRGILNREETALSSFYDRYRMVIFGLLFRILNNRTEAEDILQEVFVQVWQQAERFDEERGKAFTWLVTIARRRAIDRLRSLKSRLQTIEKANLSDPFGTDSAIEQNLFLRARQKSVRTALNQLPETQHSLLLMAYFEGCSQQEIATRTQIPLGTVKTRMRAGMIKLREILNADSNNW
jgi:RNA polymerase sigma-70 factor, ECF subfamily